ncbi:unnamed protein product [Urochloa humidicola]
MASSLAAFHPTLPHAHPILSPRRPNPTTGLLRLLPPRRRARPRAAVRLAVSAASTSAPPPSADRSEAASSLERCLSAAAAAPGAGMEAGAAAPASAPSRAPPTMKGGRKAFGAVTLEKAKLDLSQRRKKIMPELATGGGGGDIGKRIGHGGGDGGDDDGDDDDYFDDFDDGDEEEGGLFRRRIVVQELFNREFVEAVLQEWCKTMSNLPAGLRQAYEMGLVSSAQMARYLSIFARPTSTRSFSRALPGWLSRGLVGRTLADPAFPHKMAFEFMASFSSSVWWEMNIRKERLSVTIPSVGTNALGYGAFLGLYANLRYQLLCGLDQYMVKRFDVLGVAIFSTAARLMNIQIGEASRRTWLGEEADPQYSDRLLRAYKRPVEVKVDQQDSRWFISKDAIVSGLGLLGIKQGGPETTLSEPRRKRVVRKKVTSG